MRGEYAVIWDMVFSPTGSPPHAWGIRYRGNHCNGWGGLTPTCVGNTGRNKDGSLNEEAHPHIRGEYPKAIVIISDMEGSPPHASGIPGFW